MSERSDALEALANERADMKRSLQLAKEAYDAEKVRIEMAHMTEVVPLLETARREGATKTELKIAWQTTDHGTIQSLLEAAGLETVARKGRPKGARNKEPQIRREPKVSPRFESVEVDNTAAWSYNGDILSIFDGEGDTLSFEVITLADRTIMFSMVDGNIAAETAKRLDGATSGPTYDLALGYIRENGFEE